MSTTSGDVPGLLLPTVSGNQTCPPGQAAINTSTQTAQTQVALSNAVFGGNKKRGGAITVPQFSNDVCGANAVIAQTAQTSTQAASNSALDKLGGGKRRTRGKRKRMRTTRRRTGRRTIKRRTRRSKK
jgi:hypothetical protein